MSEVTTLPQCLAELMNEICSFDESLFPPRQAVTDDDTVIGKVPSWGRKAFAVATMYRRELDEVKTAIKYDGDSPELKRRACIADTKVDTVMELMWMYLRSHFQVWEEGSIGIRKDWKFVTSKGNGMPPGLRRLLLGED